MYQLIGMRNNVGMTDQQTKCLAVPLGIDWAIGTSGCFRGLVRQRAATTADSAMAMCHEPSTAARASPPLSRRYHIFVNK
jgi:hypothetical protein